VQGALVVVPKRPLAIVPRQRRAAQQHRRLNPHGADDLERELVNKESNTSLKDSLDVLFGEGKFVNSPVPENKLLEEAGFAIEAMHFQYWKGNYNEPFAVLDDFFAQSLQLLFVHLDGHIPRDYNPNVLVPDREWKAVGAVASQLDREWSSYAQALARSGLHDLSAYDVIVNALKTAGSDPSTQRLPKATSMVRQWKQDAIYLLQMRQIFLPVLVLARLTDFQDHPTIGFKFWETRAWDAIFPGSLVVDLATEDRLRKIDSEELKTFTAWLNQAVTTRQDLRELCIEPQSNMIIDRIMLNVKVVMPGGNISPLLGVAPELVQRNDFALLFKSVTQRTSEPALTGCR
ncbi:MAG: hypothetical protein ACXVA9_13955, partial [Bdellovibrionales bacterium]